MRNRIGSAALFGCLAAAFLSAASLPPVLRMPGSPEKTITAESLLGADRQDVRRENSEDGSVTVFHGSSLLDVLEKSGLDTKTMPAGRKLAPAVVIATMRDGYTAVFSIGELLMHRADPRVFLVAETAAGPLPDNEGPVRLIVYGDRTRSAYGLARIELKFLADNAPTRPH
jgi:hypothetical protein